MTQCSLTIRYTNDTSFKYVHDLIQDHSPVMVIFVEEDDGVDPNVVFTIANLLQIYKPDLQITFRSNRKELPIDELDPEIFFRGIPFNKISLNGVLYDCCDKNGKLIKF